jgi:hypothetical protein
MKKQGTLIAGLALMAAVGWSGPALAHCDTLDGPVVAAARTALETGSVAPVLVWVQQADEAEIQRAFQQARSVRKAGGGAKDLADSYFFETLVRIHRAGEGAPYTGLKPAGQVEPAVAAADKAIETGKLQPLAKLVQGRIENGLHSHFDSVLAKKNYGAADVAAGRAYVGAYVEFVHYAERLYEAAGAAASEHAAVTPDRHRH